MSDESATSGGNDIAVITAPEGTGEALSVEEATAAYLDSFKKKSSPESAETATGETESADEADAAPPEEAHGEDEEADPVAEPPIERPKSWTESEDAEWQSTPRALQQKIVARELERDNALRRSQNDAAEKLKGLSAKEQQAEEARKAYEAKLPALMESLQRQSEFADIKTMDDVRKLQLEDPFRFQAWQVYQMDAQAVEGERRQAEQRQQQEKANARTAYAQEQDAKLQELLPELKDPEKAAAIRTKAVNMLVDDYGFTESELGAIMQSDDGHRLLSDARWQKLIADGLKYAELRASPPKVIQAKLPPVQRPGAAAPKGAEASARIQALEKQFERTGSVDDAYALRMARQKRA